MRGPENLCAVGERGAELETPKASASSGEENGEGISPSPLPSRLGGLGERHKLPQRGSGSAPAPAENGLWCILSLKKTNVVMTNLIFFCHFYSRYLESNLQD